MECDNNYRRIRKLKFLIFVSFRRLFRLCVALKSIFRRFPNFFLRMASETHLGRGGESRRHCVKVLRSDLVRQGNDS